MENTISEFHIAEAERVIASMMTFENASNHGFIGWSRLELAALAQVHATIAVASAKAGA